MAIRGFVAGFADMPGRIAESDFCILNSYFCMVGEVRMQK
jgi:hypothetical protein